MKVTSRHNKQNELFLAHGLFMPRADENTFVQYITIKKVYFRYNTFGLFGCLKIQDTTEPWTCALLWKTAPDTWKWIVTNVICLQLSVTEVIPYGVFVLLLGSGGVIIWPGWGVDAAREYQGLSHHASVI